MGIIFSVPLKGLNVLHNGTRGNIFLMFNQKFPQSLILSLLSQGVDSSYWTKDAELYYEIF